MRLGLEASKIERFKVHGRQRRRRRADIEVLDDEFQGPLKYVRIDPSAEWLAQMHILQPEAMWSNMLDEAKDVQAEIEAIEGRRPAGCSALDPCSNSNRVQSFCI